MKTVKYVGTEDGLLRHNFRPWKSPFYQESLPSTYGWSYKNGASVYVNADFGINYIDVTASSPQALTDLKWLFDNCEIKDIG